MIWMELNSINGNVFKKGQFNATFVARVYRGKDNIPYTINASKFR